jgi:hypothetical protein
VRHYGRNMLLFRVKGEEIGDAGDNAGCRPG